MLVSRLSSFFIGGFLFWVLSRCFIGMLVMCLVVVSMVLFWCISRLVLVLKWLLYSLLCMLLRLIMLFWLCSFRLVLLIGSFLMVSWLKFSVMFRLSLCRVVMGSSGVLF